MPARPADAEAAILTGSRVFAEFLVAQGAAPAGPAALLTAVAHFAGLDPCLGWAGNLRRRRSDRLAVRRGARSWTFRDLSRNDAAWRAASGPCADGTYDVLVRMVADHVLIADTRPDDVLVWTGDPADPWPWAALVIGAAVDLRLSEGAAG